MFCWNGVQLEVLARVLADLSGEGVDLGVEVVEVVERDGLGGHRELDAAELGGPVVADDHVLEPEQELGRGTARR